MNLYHHFYLIVKTNLNLYNINLKFKANNSQKFDGANFIKMRF